jgi:molybdate transport system substrate-binding protein
MSNPALEVITSGAFAPALKLLSPMYEKKFSRTIRLSFGPSIGNAPDSIPSRMSRGEIFDVLILAGPALDDFITQGVIANGSKADLAGSQMAAAVRSGEPKPDLSTLDSFIKTLLDTQRIAYSASASGVYLSEEVFPKIGVEKQMATQAKKVLGVKVGDVLLSKETDLGFQQYSELLPFAGIDIIRELPPEVQKTFYFTAGIGSQTQRLEEARHFISYLASSEAAQVITNTGLDPVMPPLPWLA